MGTPRAVLLKDTLLVLASAGLLASSLLVPQRPAVHLDLSAVAADAYPADPRPAEELRAAAEAALARRYRVVSRPDRADIRLVLACAWASSRSPGRELARRLYAETADLWDPPRWSDLAGPPAGADPRIRPIDAVSLPERALRHPIFRFDSPNYPLIRTLRVQAVAANRPLSAAGEGDRAVDLLRVAFPASAPPRWAAVAAVGDMIFQRGSGDLLLSGGPAAVFGDTLSVLSRADAVVGNFEGTATSRGERTVKTYNFRFPPAVAPLLRRAGFSWVSLTNNHAWDFGSEAFLDTVRNLTAAGIGVSGAGSDLDEARIPWAWEGPGGPFGFFSFGAYPREGNGFDGASTAAAGPEKPGILWATDAEVERFGSAAAPFFAALVSVHGGHEWESVPRPAFRDLYRRFVDLGADAVFAHHPHVLQGIEIRSGRPIFYSLGNFVFPGMEDEAHATESVIALVGFLDGRPVSLDLYPVLLDGPRVRLDPRPDTLLRLRALSGSIPR